jgi:hypothetical protein
MEAARHDTNTLVFQTPVWTDSLTSLPEYEDASRLYETQDGRLLILPLIRRRAALSSLAAYGSMPDGWGMGGVISAQPVTTEDARQILADLSGLRGQKITLRPNPLTADIWNGRQAGRFKPVPRESHILDISGGFDTVWSERFPSATRTKIRKAEKAGLDIQVGKGGELLDTFYEVYMKWVEERASERRLPNAVERWIGRLREPRRKFDAAAQALGEAFQVWVARLENTPIAAAILLIGQHQAVYWRSASVKQLAGPSRANDLLQNHMIAEACAAGCRYYHMGESGGVESLKHFKTRFGAQPYPYPGYVQERLPLSRAGGVVGKVSKRIEQRLAKKGASPPA